MKFSGCDRQRQAQGSSVQAETEVQKAFNLSEWMTPECLEVLTLVDKIPGKRQGF